MKQLNQSQRLFVAAVLLVASILLVFLDLQRGSSPSSDLDRGRIDVQTLHNQLIQLPVAPEHGVGYDRAKFRHWIDEDHDCFNTRHEVLRVQSISPVQVDVGGQCLVRAGDWHSKYDGVAVEDPSELDIDHLVPLAEAWDSGAWSWSDTKREAFANDLGHADALIAVTQKSNRSKGRGDPTDWMPPDRGVHCWYTQAWIEVKSRWGLSVDPLERQTLEELLWACQ